MTEKNISVNKKNDICFAKQIDEVNEVVKKLIYWINETYNSDTEEMYEVRGSFTGGVSAKSKDDAWERATPDNITLDEVDLDDVSDNKNIYKNELSFIHLVPDNLQFEIDKNFNSDYTSAYYNNSEVKKSQGQICGTINEFVNLLDKLKEKEVEKQLDEALNVSDN